MLSWQNYTQCRQEKKFTLKRLSTSLSFKYEQLFPRIKISYCSPYSLRGMKRKLRPCERGCGVRPLMVTDDVYGWLRKRTKWSESRGKGIARFIFRRKTTPLSLILVEQRRLLFFFTVSGDGPISLSRFKPPFARAPDHIFSNCCCHAEQGYPITLKLPYIDF